MTMMPTGSKWPSILDYLGQLGVGLMQANQPGVDLFSGLGQGFANANQMGRQARQDQRLDEMSALQKQQIEMQIAAQAQKAEQAAAWQKRIGLMTAPTETQNWFNQPRQGPSQLQQDGVDIPPSLMGLIGDPEQGAGLMFSAYNQAQTRKGQEARDRVQDTHWQQNFDQDASQFDANQQLQREQLNVSRMNANKGPAAPEDVRTAQYMFPGDEAKQREWLIQKNSGNTLGEGPFGKGDPLNTIQTLAPAIKDGTATPDQVRAYGLAYFDATKAQPQYVADPDNPGGMKLVVVPRQLPPDIPPPPSGVAPTTDVPGAGKPPSGDTAKLLGFVDSALTNAEDVISMLFKPDGSLNKELIVLNKLPWHGGSAEASKYGSAWYALADADIRLRTGAAAPRQEIEQHAREMMPGLEDNEESARFKIENATKIAKQIKGSFSPGKAKAAPVEPETAPRTEFKPKDVPKLGDVRNGYEFLGGDPALKKNWAKRP